MPPHRPDPLIAFMGELLLRAGMEGSESEKPSFVLVPDNARIHAQNSSYQHLPRPSSCPEIHATLRALQWREGMPRVASTGSLGSRWDNACGSKSPEGKQNRPNRPTRKDDGNTSYTDLHCLDESEGFGDFGLILEETDDAQSSSDGMDTLGWNAVSATTA